MAISGPSRRHGWIRRVDATPKVVSIRRETFWGPFFRRVDVFMTKFENSRGRLEP